MYKIEKGIVMPERVFGRHRIYPFSIMEVGDSFFIPGTDMNELRKKQISVKGSVRGKINIQTSVVYGGIDMTPTGLRVWRVADA